MKKLALVLGSLLVVGSVASAKEVMPAPTAAPEVVVKVVEKPVVVYKEKEAAWKPNGQVEVSLKTKGDTRKRVKPSNNEPKKVKGWKTAELKTKGNVNFTPKQELKFEYTDNLGYKSRDDQNSGTASHGKTKLTHVYKFDKMMRLESEFDVYKSAKDIVKFAGLEGKGRTIKEKLVFDFSDYFFKNDYVKATALELAPEYAYSWEHGAHNNHFGLYANAEFELPYGVTFQAEFNDLFAYDRLKTDGDSESYKSSSMELTLGKDFVYANGPHKVIAGLEGKYETAVFWNAKKYEEKKVQSHEFTFEPTLKYEFKATDYVTLWSKVGAEFKYNREKVSKDDTTTRTRTAQPYAEVGFKTTF